MHMRGVGGSSRPLRNDLRFVVLAEDLESWPEDAQPTRS